MTFSFSLLHPSSKSLDIVAGAHLPYPITVTSGSCERKRKVEVNSSYMIDQLQIYTFSRIKLTSIRHPIFLLFPTTTVITTVTTTSSHQIHDDDIEEEMI